jgi:hypothetical protein
MFGGAHGILLKCIADEEHKEINSLSPFVRGLK